MDAIPKEQKTIENESSEAKPMGQSLERERSAEIMAPEAVPVKSPTISVDEEAALIVSPDVIPVVAPAKSQLEKEIEDVLAEDLEGLYWELPESERLIFKHKGEETASIIRLLLAEANVRVQEIFRLIVEWLKLLPGLSQFFVEQEAKIKTDKLLKFR